jgi:hypothetical protein
MNKAPEPFQGELSNSQRAGLRVLRAWFAMQRPLDGGPSAGGSERTAVHREPIRRPGSANSPSSPARAIRPRSASKFFRRLR